VGEQGVGAVLLLGLDIDEAVSGAKEELQVVQGVLRHAGFYLASPSTLPSCRFLAMSLRDIVRRTRPEETEEEDT